MKPVLLHPDEFICCGVRSILTVRRTREFFNRDTLICRCGSESFGFCSPLGGSDAEESEGRNSCMLPCALRPILVPQSRMNSSFRDCCFYYYYYL